MENPAILAEQDDYQRVLHIGEVAFTFYQLQRTAPTEADYRLWLDQLPEDQKSYYQTLGFCTCRNEADFKRFFRLLLKNEMYQFMQQNLPKEDFELWQLKRHTPCTA